MRIFISFILIFWGILTKVFSQEIITQEKTDTTETVFTKNIVADQEDLIFEITEKMPLFPGGVADMMKFISSYLLYPDIAIKNGIEGTVIVGFIVELDGSLTNLKLLKDIGGGCGTEAMNVVKLMPNWTPGFQNGKPVRSYMKIPIKFKLSKKL